MRKWLMIGLILVLMQAAVLYLFGQPPICECGTAKLWEGVVQSEGNSQHLSDWYTPSHLIHGILFYVLFWVLFPRSSVWLRLMLAIGLEVSWELLENTPWVIDRYRQQALAQGYVGDSIINSVMDTAAMAAGFLLARKASVAVSIALIIILELWVGAMIRDNLTLNVIQLLVPIEAIRDWQVGA